MNLRVNAARMSEFVVVRRRALVARLQRTTPRERLLVGGLVAGVIVWVPLAAMEWRSVEAERYSEAMSELSAANLSLDAARRVANAADARALIDMRQWGFRATNVAVASVLIEQRLVDVAESAGLTGARVTVTSELADESAVDWLEAEIQADLVWSGVFRLMDSVSEWPEGFRVTRFRYELRPVPEGTVVFAGGPPVGTVQIGLAFPVSVDVTSETGSAEASPSPEPASRTAQRP